METQQITQYVDLVTFITVDLALLTLIIVGLWVVINKVIDLRERVSVVENGNDNDVNNIEALWSKIDVMERQRNTDVIQFTETLGKLNVTLGKMEVTLDNSNKVMEKLQEKLDEQDKQINKLVGQVGNA